MANKTVTIVQEDPIDDTVGDLVEIAFRTVRQPDGTRLKTLTLEYQTGGHFYRKVWIVGGGANLPGTITQAKLREFKNACLAEARLDPDWGF